MRIFNNKSAHVLEIHELLHLSAAHGSTNFATNDHTNCSQQFPHSLAIAQCEPLTGLTVD